MVHYDAIVVGCGAMGSAVSYNLALRGLKVLTLDRFSLNHDRGSSHGKTRIIRQTYYEDERYVPMLKRAFESWREIERVSGRRLMMMTGGLMVGREEGELVGGVLRSARNHGLGHTLMSAREGEERFGAFTLDEEVSVVYDHTAGILFPEECIQAFVGAAMNQGGKFEFSREVDAWRPSKEGVEVVAGGESLLADRVVFCAGPWTRKLVGDVAPLVCERQVPLWFSSDGREEFRPEKFPVFIMEEGGGELFYGIPDVGDGVKVARTHAGKTVDPDEVDRQVGEEDVAPVRRFIEKRLKSLGRVPVESTTCIYTNTPDLNFALGHHPADKRVIVVSACSGHGFKFASVMGGVVADMATGRKVGFDTSFLALDRFAGKL